MSRDPGELVEEQDDLLLRLARFDRVGETSKSLVPARRRRQMCAFVEGRRERLGEDPQVIGERPVETSDQCEVDDGLVLEEAPNQERLSNTPPPVDRQKFGLSRAEEPFESRPFGGSAAEGSINFRHNST